MGFSSPPHCYILNKTITFGTYLSDYTRLELISSKQKKKLTPPGGVGIILPEDMEKSLEKNDQPPSGQSARKEVFVGN